VEQSANSAAPTAVIVSNLIDATERSRSIAVASLNSPSVAVSQSGGKRHLTG
jgi:hypothetical protein